MVSLFTSRTGADCIDTEVLENVGRVAGFIGEVLVIVFIGKLVRDGLAFLRGYDFMALGTTTSTSK